MGIFEIPIISNRSSIRNVFINWWFQAGHKTMIDVFKHNLPGIVCCHIWKAYANMVWGQGAVSFPTTENLIIQIKLYTQTWVQSWGKLKFRSVDNILYEEKLIPYNFKTGSSKVAIAKWIKPKGQLKLNIDASFSPDGAAGGAIVRNERGEMLFALCFPLSADSSLEAELKAIVTATKWALSSGYGDFMVESDASRAVELISAKREGRWYSLVQEMALSTSQTQVGFRHIWRERNWAAHYIAASKSAQFSVINSINYLSDLSRKTYFLDYFGIPSLRYVSFCY
ncbi:unnamed protein product [Cuscuta epithymum]|uniref:RNase H type-1 domain-containing protein n=1 Tax=Cuscuta epithymum TaxID=186058 RepID=A0AAV0EC38_9ASTE|nr:unnamed protein product [Cuscuta epithymum]